MAAQQHWQAFYTQPHAAPEAPSPLAEHLLRTHLADPDVRARTRLLDLGCGSGRDSVAFARAGVGFVYGVDGSREAVLAAHALAAGIDPARCRFLAFTFEELLAFDDGFLDMFTIVYCRFVLHAVPAAVADGLLRLAVRQLAPGGLLAVEARTTRDALYGQGTPAPADASGHVDPDAWVSGHYRRFVDASALRAQLTSAPLHLTLVEDHEGQGLSAQSADNDPYLVRLVAKKPLA
jgi:SAM-dependent methyltransferase